MSTLPGAFASSLQQAALLIDADNFSDAHSINAAWAQIKSRAGRVSVCRAYGSPTRLQALAGVWRVLGARTIPNLALDKNTTDAALVADAVALHFQQAVRIFAIASGDADFAPLAVRLREWGCEVWCFSMEGILFQGAQDYYDRVVCFSPQPAVAAAPAIALAALVPPFKLAKPSTDPAAGAPPSTRTVAPAVAVVAPVVLRSPKNLPGPVAIKPVVRVAAQLALFAAASDSAPASVASRPLSPQIQDGDVARILKAVPKLKDGPQPLAEVVPVLRKMNVLGKTTKVTAYFSRLIAHFKLSPAQQPTHLVFIASLPAIAKAAAIASTQAVRPVQKAVAPKTVVVTEEVLSWPVVNKRQVAPPLRAELHALRVALGQLATLRVSVADVLLAVPEMLKGQPCALSAVAGRLREKKLLRTDQSALRVLERHPDAFVVRMDSAPQTVRYLT